MLHIESGRHLYGGAKQVGYLIAGLAARGVENVLVCPKDQPLARMEVATAVEELPMFGDFDLGLPRRLTRVMTRFRPDLVHVHSRRGADLFAGLASRSAQRPAILTRRVDNPESIAWARLKYRPYRFVVAISKAIERELREHVGLDPARVRRVPSAVDTGEYRPDALARERLLAAFALPSGSFLVAVAAQLIPRKGHDLLLSCLPEILGRHPHLRVLLFGRGPEEKRILRALKRGRLAQYVRLAGFRPDMASLLPGLDLLVHPAEGEGLGAVLLEAMSCGVAVVATAVGGIVDVVENGATGLLVPAGSKSGLAAAIGRLVADDGERRTLAEAARIRVREQFTIGAMTDRYLDIYADACG